MKKSSSPLPPFLHFSPAKKGIEKGELACTVGFHTDDDDGDSARLFVLESLLLFSLLLPYSLSFSAFFISSNGMQEN